MDEEKNFPIEIGFRKGDRAEFRRFVERFFARFEVLAIKSFGQDFAENDLFRDIKVLNANDRAQLWVNVKHKNDPQHKAKEVHFGVQLKDGKPTGSVVATAKSRIDGDSKGPVFRPEIFRISGSLDDVFQDQKFINWMGAEVVDGPDDQVENNMEAPSASQIERNRILYGPPGTGKTYETIYASLQVLDPAVAEAYKLVADDELASREQRLAARTALKARFDALSAEQRVRFVTFHQSFSYEDFVEGLRAETVNGQVHYRVASGVFKQICEDAGATPERVSLDALLDRFIEQVAETPEMLETATGKQFLVSYSEGNATLTCEPQASKTAISLPANIEHVRALLTGKPVAKLYCASYVKGIAEHIRKQLPSTEASPLSGSAGLPHVLIIDEINRGNISRIFGELITLIEPSKRAGAEEALSVTLPYSKDPFSVPDNVYLIGTMNTADRSLAGLDLALRRRFSFTEMPPRPELLDAVVVDGISIGRMLRVMNQRITVLLDRDHTIGHAYFMPLQKKGSTLAGLADIFRQKILPLLQEYFFEDWERIRWVLNDQSKPDSTAFIIEDTGLNLSVLFGSVHNKLRQTPKWKLNLEAFDNPAAYCGIATDFGQIASAEPAAEEAIA